MPSASRETVHVEVDSERRLISRSPALQRVFREIQQVATADVSVLITGETGTGKELVARLVHKLSHRASRQFVAVDCNAVAPTLLESEFFGHERGAFTGADRQRVGVFELADGGTLFLDEIANLALEAQAKLLRVLQEREFRRVGGCSPIHSDFRLITASNADLASRVRAGTFRDDLFHRLKVFEILLPPLRERREDIPLLVSYFIDRKRLTLKRPGVFRVSHEALDLLVARDWPGNVRELENVIERAIVECPGEMIEAAHLVLGAHSGSGQLPAEDMGLPFRAARKRALETFESLYLLSLLRRCQGSIKQVALHSGITTKHVRTLMKRRGLSRRDFRPLRRRSPRAPVTSGTQQR